MSKSYWNLLKSHLKDSFEKDYDLWIQPVTCVKEHDGEITLELPNEYYKNVFFERYKQKSEEFLSRNFNKDFKIIFTIGNKKDNDNKNTDSSVDEDLDQEIEIEVTSTANENSLNSSLLSILNPNFTFNNFVVGTNNEIAIAAAKSILRSPGKSYNPLFIYGGVGLGKTHLQQAIGHDFHRKYAGRYIIYNTCEQFTNEFIRSIQEKRMHSFRLKYRNADILLIDDIQFLESKEGVQEELFHTYNQLRESGKQMIFTSDRAPKELKSIQDRLISRFSSGLTVEIETPDKLTKIAIIRQKATLNNVIINDEIIGYMVENEFISIRDIEAGVAKLKLLAEMNVDITCLQKVIPFLKDTFASIKETKIISITDIQNTVAEYYHLTNQELLSKIRKGNVSLARQLAMYLARQFTKCSVREIGEQFGGKNHSSVIFAMNRVSNQIQNDPTIKKDYKIIYEKLVS